MIPDRVADPETRARAAARERLLNALLREAGPAVLGAPVTGPGPVRIGPVGGDGLVARIRRWSPSGHHRWDDDVALDGATHDGGRVGGTDVDGGVGGVGGAVSRSATHDEVVDRLLAVVEALCPDAPAGARAALGAQVAVSVERTARYLAAPPRPEPADPHGRTRHAEQSVRLGHPFHPVPKSVEGPHPGHPATLEPPDDLDPCDRIAPELGAAFRLHYLALDPTLVVGERVVPGEWIPAAVVEAAIARIGPDPILLPVHPRQAAYLAGLDEVRRLTAAGRLRDLGPLGAQVYPTSSVRTVCDPAFATTWKLPLHLRITNFVRTVPPEHAARSVDASRAVLALRAGRERPGFGVVVESGWRGVDPAVVGDDVAADLTVLFRENPFVTGGLAPRVVAGLVEEGPDGAPPPLVGEVRASGLDPADWLRAYLDITLLPLLDVFAVDGIGFEAHLQNSLLHTEGGRPVRFWVRDMEGAHVSRARRPTSVAPDSPLVYDEDEAWQRLRYHAVVNHLATVIAVLGHHLSVGEPALWRVVDATLADLPPAHAAAPYAADLRTSATLPAKANLISRFTGRAERPRYVDLPNPIRLMGAS